MFDRVTVLKPWISATTVYLPVGSDGAVYSPSRPLVTTRVVPVPTLVSVTVAPGTTAPELSVTVPTIVPVTAWANAGGDQRDATRTRNRNRPPRFMVPPIFRCRTRRAFTWRARSY